MSTKALRMLIEKLRRRDGEMGSLLDAAEREVEEIERAATYAAAGAIDSESEEAKHFMDTMLVIHDQRTANGGGRS